MMVPPRQQRRLQHRFRETYFKPRGIPLRSLKKVSITTEELEALRLQYHEHKTQTEAATMMGISQSQFQRDITKALENISAALIKGYAIHIEKPKYSKNNISKNKNK